jgi:hypothetical protein
LCAVGYTTPPFYEGVEYEELGISSCRVRVTMLPHPGHPEWADLSMELLCFRAFEAVESAALMVLHALSTHRPQEMLQTPLGLFRDLYPNDPLWLGRMANIATLLETVPPYNTVQTLGTSLRALYALQDLRRVIADDLAGHLTGATWYIHWVVSLYIEQHNDFVKALQTIADLQGQILQFLVDRGDHLQQVLDLLDGQQELQAQLDDRDAERLVHLEHIQDLQEQVGDLKLDIEALEGVVGMLQQLEIQLDPEEVQDVPGLDLRSLALDSYMSRGTLHSLYIGPRS